MLSSLDALASKISPGSGNNSPSQQANNNNQQLQHNQVQKSLSRSILRSPLCYQTDLKTEIQNETDCPDSQTNQSLRLNGNHSHSHHHHHHNHYHQQHHNNNNGLDSNGNKLCHITHNSIHPYQKQPSSPCGNGITGHHHNHSHNHNHLLQQTKLANYHHHHQSSSSSSSPPTTPLPLSSLSPQECPQQRQQQHELFQQQLQQQQQQLLKQQQSAVASPPLSPTTSTSQPYDENDSQHDFGSCLKENAFGMSDKSSTTNSLPNSPIHNNNNNSSLLNKNNPVSNLCTNNNHANAINNNNNNTCSTNRNLMTLDGNESCFRMDTDTPFLREEPDPDNIKMFVGQVPKSMDEAQLRAMFEEYGPVHSINVLRDKATGISKGCCFVTFYTRRAALKAQDALHNVKTLNGMYHPIQMKPADSENRNERKLFIGMLNKKLNENDVRKLFEVHGAIEECTVLRDQNGQSKGCAFVTYATKHSAISAIKTLNQNKTMEGCTSPLVVKFADTQKEKEQKKIQQIQANLWNLATNMNIPLGQTATTVSTPTIMPSTPQQASPVLGADAITPASLQLLQQLQAVGLQQQLLQGLGAQTNTADSAAATAAAAAAGLLPPMTVQNLAALAAMTQSSLTNTASNPGNAQLTNTAALLCLLGKSANTGADPNNFASAYMSTAAGLPQFGSTALTSPLASVALSSAAAAAAGKQIEGPEGCNLFIYHLPQEFTDTDLASTFLPFGNVISAKVFIDKQTNLSKCFGFVSFDNPESAQVAIRAMNGFQVGTKRLKVQLKKPKDASKPY
ncbi:bruno 1 isoform X2 [Haematobia irritans]|uniref:bruno 1 isoform X2 n=1 Tax=Haematobia irritans TaxID=7368 RepID=UPI003F4F5840